MNEPLKPKQELVIWNLLITGDEPMMSKVKPGLNPTERRTLVNTGLIRLEKRGQAKHLVLEDKAWDWVSERIGSEDFTVKFPATATTAIPVFQTLLMKLGHYLRSHNIPIADLLADSASTEVSIEPPPAEIPKPDSLKDEIRKAYAQASQNSAGLGIRLKQLRQHFKPVEPQSLDDALRSMQRSGEIYLMPMEYPQDIGPEDEQAAIDLGDGEKRYFIYIQN
ncbi:hypothetical protein IQ241_14340 [Romeria aff. gracilis LEGE 07310]|uniref:Uncharacterized protein n=1 Tax=Vasconcelosia minhoensis LEGE 07310 TaxID=915328 RepID=A0A8J7AFU6_9CYAN|nr:hypothetical protein [Romeria gracilis]MBE9078461.1 hypothetical protein [Romeria aff. gracilis LEGE 07310]